MRIDDTPKLELKDLRTFLEKNNNRVPTYVLTENFPLTNTQIRSLVFDGFLDVRKPGIVSATPKFFKELSRTFPEGKIWLDTGTIERIKRPPNSLLNYHITATITQRAVAQKVFLAALHFDDNLYRLSAFPVRFFHSDSHIVFDFVSKSPDRLISYARAAERKAMWELGNYYRSLAISGLTPEASVPLALEVLPEIERRGYGRPWKFSPLTDFSFTTLGDNVYEPSHVANVRIEPATNTIVLGKDYLKLPSAEFHGVLPRILDATGFYAKNIGSIILKTGFPVLAGLGIVFSVKHVAQADDKIDAALEEGSGFAGGLSAGSAAALAASPTGPIGMIIAGVAGSVVGDLSARMAYRSVADEKARKPESSQDIPFNMMPFADVVETETQQPSVENSGSQPISSHEPEPSIFQPPAEIPESPPVFTEEPQAAAKQKKLVSTSKNQEPVTPSRQIPETLSDEEKLRRFAAYHNIDLVKFSDFDRKTIIAHLKQLEEYEKEQNLAIQMQQVRATFASLHNIGAMLGSQSLMRAASGLDGFAQTVQAFHAIKALPALSTTLGAGSGVMGTAMAGLAFGGPYLAAIAGVMQIGVTIFGKNRKDKSAEQIMQAIRQVWEFLGIIRKEMHDRFDDLSEDQKKLLFQLDVYYFELRTVIQMNHDTMLTNLVHVSDNVDEDLRQMERILGDLIRTAHLNDFKKSLLSIARHRDGSVSGSSSADVSENLRKTIAELDELWLSDNLVKPAYNGEIYATESTRKDKRFVGIDPPRAEYALGFLYRKARELNMASALLRVDESKLPHVDLWIHAVLTSIAGRQRLRKMYKSPANEDAQAIKKLQAIARNTLKFVDVLQNEKHAVHLYGAIKEKYCAALQKMEVELIRKLTIQLRLTPAFYTLKRAIEQGLLDPSIGQTGTPMSEKIISNRQSSETRLPFLLLVALRLGLVELSGRHEVTRKPSDAYWGGPTGIKNTFSIRQSFVEADVLTRYALSIGDVRIIHEDALLLRSETRKPEKKHNVKKSWYNITLRQMKNSAKRESEETHDAQLIEEAELKKIYVDGSLKHVLNEQFSEVLAIIIFNKLKSGESWVDILGNALAPIAEGLFADAVKEAINDRAVLGEHLDTLQVMRGLAEAYADLIGFPESSIKEIASLFGVDYHTMLQDPVNFVTVTRELDKIQTLVEKAAPDARSRVKAKMLAASNGLNRYANEIQLSNDFEKALASFRHDAKSVRLLKKQRDAIKHLASRMESVASVFGNPLMDEMAEQIALQKAHLSQAYDSLNTVRSRLQSLGYDVDEIENPEIALDHASSTLEASDDKVHLLRGESFSLPDMQGRTLVDVLTASRNPYEDARLYLSQLTDDQAKIIVDESNEQGTTPLHVAASLGDLPLIELLVGFAAKISVMDKSGNTPRDCLHPEARRAGIFVDLCRKWEQEGEDLGFSMTGAAGLLKEAIRVINGFPRAVKPCVIVVGGTGDGKSTLHNFFHGTDYKPVIEEGLELLQPCNDVPELSRTGSSSQSVTAFPQIHSMGANFRIDMPGYGDTSDTFGKEKDIRTAVSIFLATQNCESIQSIELVSPEDYVFDTRFKNLRDTLRKIGGMISSDPVNLMPHVLLVITKSTRLKGTSKEQIANHEQLIYSRLKKWADEMKMIPSTHRDYAIRVVLDHLTAKNIILVDAAHPSFRQHYQDRLETLPVTPREHFNFASFSDENTKAITRLIEKLNSDHQSRQAEITRARATAFQQWRHEMLEHFQIESKLYEETLHPDLQEVFKLHASMAQLRKTLFPTWEAGFDNFSEPDQATDDDASISFNPFQWLLRLMDESDMNQPLLQKIAPIAKSLNLQTHAGNGNLYVAPIVEFLEQEVDKSTCSDFPQDDDKRDIPLLDIPHFEQLLNGTYEALPSYEDVSTQTAISRVYDHSPVDDSKPLYESTVDEQLVFLQFVFHLFAPFMPWHFKQPLSSEDADYCERILFQLEMYKRQVTTRAKEHGISEYLLWLHNKIRDLRNDVTRIIDGQEVSTEQLASLTSGFQRASEEIEEIEKNDNAPRVTVKRMQRDGMEHFSWRPDLYGALQPQQPTGPLIGVSQQYLPIAPGSSSNLR